MINPSEGRDQSQSAEWQGMHWSACVRSSAESRNATKGEGVQSAQLKRVRNVPHLDQPAAAVESPRRRPRHHHRRFPRTARAHQVITKCRWGGQLCPCPPDG